MSDVEWLHPSSFNPSIWNGIYSKIRKADSERGHHSSEDMAAEPSAVPQSACQAESMCTPFEKEVDDLVRLLDGQYNSMLVSDRVYMCLEERAVSAREGGLLASLGNGDAGGGQRSSSGSNSKGREPESPRSADVATQKQMGVTACNAVNQLQVSSKIVYAD
jgi:hypothetical protein